MSRWIVIIIMAVAAGVLSFFIYSESRNIASSPVEREGGELAWLRAEFSLTDEQFAEIERIHAEFRPICEALCNKVIEIQERLDRAIVESGALTSELEGELAEFARVQEECNRFMLRHAYAVADLLPPGDRPRYLAAVGGQITLHGHGR